MSHDDMRVFTLCIYTNTVSTSTVQDTPSYSTGFHHAEHSKQDIST